ncbi:hypothetical protein CNMCM5793_005093 [Aspergillus hiratsukae]|uniref:Uncharacterized protein n=1 Tax=Aspergillus hiratsukae TaxID=1194566 RepID=A0A8H6QEV3_9EURO|nr:hypothetical protein CNMCM5793_005093 [Aspergillus hiratsukae]KAF7172365.1 hypothetical protein CNMCM6106_006576 [Aspergillus hiratsukae]
MNSKLWDCDTEKMIISGHDIIFKTEDPDAYPLPSKKILELQWILNRVLALSGATNMHEEDYDPDLGFDLVRSLTALECEGSDDEQEDVGSLPASTCRRRPSLSRHAAELHEKKTIYRRGPRESTRTASGNLRAVVNLDSILQKLSIQTPLTNTTKAIDRLLEENKEDMAGAERVAKAIKKALDEI